MEIERKFLVNKLPEGLNLIGEFYIEQGYLSLEPEVRIRKRINEGPLPTDFILTIKGNGDIQRDEIEILLTEDQYYNLKYLIPNEFISKDYKKFLLDDGHILEYNEVDIDKDTAFIYAEIEFDNLVDANNFIVPEYLSKEVTYDKEFKMKNYWRNTRMK